MSDWLSKRKKLATQLVLTAAGVGAICYAFGAERHDNVPGPHDVQPDQTGASQNCVLEPCRAHRKTVSNLVKLGMLRQKFEEILSQFTFDDTEFDSMRYRRDKIDAFCDILQQRQRQNELTDISMEHNLTSTTPRLHTVIPDDTIRKEDAIVIDADTTGKCPLVGEDNRCEFEFDPTQCLFWLLLPTKLALSSGFIQSAACMLLLSSATLAVSVEILYMAIRDRVPLVSLLLLIIATLVLAAQIVVLLVRSVSFSIDLIHATWKPYWDFEYMLIGCVGCGKRCFRAENVPKWSVRLGDAMRWGMWVIIVVGSLVALSNDDLLGMKDHLLFEQMWTAYSLMSLCVCVVAKFVYVSVLVCRWIQELVREIWLSRDPIEEAVHQLSWIRRPCDAFLPSVQLRPPVIEILWIVSPILICIIFGTVAQSEFGWGTVIIFSLCYINFVLFKRNQWMDRQCLRDSNITGGTQICIGRSCLCVSLCYVIGFIMLLWFVGPSSLGSPKAPFRTDAYVPFYDICEKDFTSYHGTVPQKETTLTIQDITHLTALVYEDGPGFQTAEDMQNRVNAAFGKNVLEVIDWCPTCEPAALSLSNPSRELIIVSIRGTRKQSDAVESIMLYGVPVVLNWLNHVVPLTNWWGHHLTGKFLTGCDRFRRTLTGARRVSGFRNMKAFVHKTIDEIEGVDNAPYFDAVDGKDRTVYLIGHSLGGGLAQLVGGALRGEFKSRQTFMVGIGAPGALYSSNFHGVNAADIVSAAAVVAAANDFVPTLDGATSSVHPISCPQSAWVGCHSKGQTFCTLQRGCGTSRNANPEYYKCLCEKPMGECAV